MNQFIGWLSFFASHWPTSSAEGEKNKKKLQKFKELNVTTNLILRNKQRMLFVLDKTCFTLVISSRKSKEKF